MLRRLFAVGVFAGLCALVVQLMPDIKRYLRMRCM